MKKNRITLLGVAVGFVLFAVSASPAWAQSVSDTYKAKCAMCHGADGKGDTSAGKAMGAHNFASPEIQKMSDAELESIITKGKGKMPEYGTKLKESEIKELVSYVRELGKGK